MDSEAKGLGLPESKKQNQQPKNSRISSIFQSVEGSVDVGVIAEFVLLMAETALLAKSTRRLGKDVSRELMRILSEENDKICRKKKRN